MFLGQFPQPYLLSILPVPSTVTDSIWGYKGELAIRTQEIVRLQGGTEGWTYGQFHNQGAMAEELTQETPNIYMSQKL